MLKIKNWLKQLLGTGLIISISFIPLNNVPLERQSANAEKILLPIQVELRAEHKPPQNQTDQIEREIVDIDARIKEIQVAIDLIWKNQAKQAKQIVACESGYNPEAVGDSGQSIGLFQIYLPAHPQYKKEDLMNIYFNTSEAYKIYQKSGWINWKNCSKRLGFL